MMGGSRKALDLRRDPRLELHSSSDDPFTADAKLAGRAVDVTDSAAMEAVFQHTGEQPPAGSHLFRVDIARVVLVRLGDPPDHLLIEIWREGQDELTRIERR